MKTTGNSQWKSALDWLFCTDWGMHIASRPDRVRKYNISKRMIPLDRLLDSPCPRWMLNAITCDTLSYRQRIKLILKHHEMICGQTIKTSLLKTNINDRKKKQNGII